MLTPEQQLICRIIRDNGGWLKTQAIEALCRSSNDEILFNPWSVNVQNVRSGNYISVHEQDYYNWLQEQSEASA